MLHKSKKSKPSSKGYENALDLQKNIEDDGELEGPDGNSLNYEVSKTGIIFPNDNVIDLNNFKNLSSLINESEGAMSQFFFKDYFSTEAYMAKFPNIIKDRIELTKIYDMHVIYYNLLHIFHNGNEILLNNKKVQIKATDEDGGEIKTYEPLKINTKKLLNIILQGGSEEPIVSDKVSKKLKEKGPTYLHYQYMPFIRFICDLFKINISELKDIDSNSEFDDFKYSEVESDYQYTYNMSGGSVREMYNQIKSSVGATTNIVNTFTKDSITDVKQTIQEYCV